MEELANITRTTATCCTALRKCIAEHAAFAINPIALKAESVVFILVNDCNRLFFQILLISTVIAILVTTTFLLSIFSSALRMKVLMNMLVNSALLSRKFNWWNINHYLYVIISKTNDKFFKIVKKAHVESSITFFVFV